MLEWQDLTLAIRGIYNIKLWLELSLRQRSMKMADDWWLHQWCWISLGRIAEIRYIRALVRVLDCIIYRTVLQFLTTTYRRFAPHYFRLLLHTVNCPIPVSSMIFAHLLPSNVYILLLYDNGGFFLFPCTPRLRNHLVSRQMTLPPSKPKQTDFLN